jgi:hypothetical protein
MRDVSRAAGQRTSSEPATTAGSRRELERRICELQPGRFMHRFHCASGSDGIFDGSI